MIPWPSFAAIVAAIRSHTPLELVLIAIFLAASVASIVGMIWFAQTHRGRCIRCGKRIRPDQVECAECGGDRWWPAAGKDPE